MGTGSSRIGEYMKLTQEQRVLVKRVWTGIENNPQFHGSVFFMGFCEIHPQYVKYFTIESQLPLTFDPYTNAKFTIIMETMGYLLLDFHNKPKQLDRIIGYIAMIHKDMNLSKLDMFNFGSSLLKYLAVTFPIAMTPDSANVVSQYMNSLLKELSQKIEDLNKNEIRGEFQASDTTGIPCSSWLFCGENLIYGQTLDYWKERKQCWDKRLEEFKVKEPGNLPKTSSIDDEDTSPLKSKTEDETSEFSESTAQLLESHGIPRTTRIGSSPMNSQRESRSDKFSTPTRPGRRLYEVNKQATIVDKVATMLESGVSMSYKTPREKRRSLFDETARSNARAERTWTSSIPDEEAKSFRSSTEDPASLDFRVLRKLEKRDSAARQRRRLSRARSETT